jgi:ABC-type microcin C transport system duplicated ATPase subunit YejF
VAIHYIIAEGLDVNFFSQKEDAERKLEAIDVIDGVYVGYDAMGRLLDISPAGQSARIALAEEAPTHLEQLRVLLIDYLTAVGRTPIKGDVAAMLGQCEQYAQ